MKNTFVLRKWQKQCVQQVLRKYRQGKRHFLCLATPGAGKTLMAAEVAKQLLDRKNIEFVLCFSPSKIVARDFQITLEKHLRNRLDGALGSIGSSYTYQGMQSIPPEIWKLLESFNVLVIFDEIHHCSGSKEEGANVWGQTILNRINQKAAFSLALSGTPWRSDNLPIVLSEYYDGRISCDFVYGLSESIKDNVCRRPQIIAIDNDRIIYQPHEGDRQTFKCFSDLLNETTIPYQRLVETRSFNEQMLKVADKKLTGIRRTVPNAGGLVVATSVSHAQQIYSYIKNTLKKSVTVVSYRDNNATSIIQNFKNDTTVWIVSIGMISEGTNIPRLQVCCHLTRIKTELHFRQILGRIIRSNAIEKTNAYLYIPAHADLVAYATRVAEDIPDVCGVFQQIAGNGIPNDELPELHMTAYESTVTSHDQLLLGTQGNSFDSQECNEKRPATVSTLLRDYDCSLDVSGRYKKQVIAFSSPLS